MNLAASTASLFLSFPLYFLASSQTKSRELTSEGGSIDDGKLERKVIGNSRG